MSSNLHGLYWRLKNWIETVELGPAITAGDILIVVPNSIVGRLSSLGVTAGYVLIKDPASPYGLRWAPGTAVTGGVGVVPGPPGEDGEPGPMGPPGPQGPAGTGGSGSGLTHPEVMSRLSLRF